MPGAQEGALESATPQWRLLPQVCQCDFKMTLCKLRKLPCGRHDNSWRWSVAQMGTQMCGLAPSKGCRSALGRPLLTACGPPTGDVVDVYQREFLALRDRLHAAEQESLKRSKELNLVLDEIKRAVSERQALRDRDGNRTWARLTGERPMGGRGGGALAGPRSDPPLLTLPEDPRLRPWNVSHKHVLHLPTVFHHLPHLLAKESSLQPAVRVGQGRTGGRAGPGGGAGGGGPVARPEVPCSAQCRW